MPDVGGLIGGVGWSVWGTPAESGGGTLDVAGPGAVDEPSGGGGAGWWLRLPHAATRTHATNDKNFMAAKGCEEHAERLRARLPRRARTLVRLALIVGGDISDIAGRFTVVGQAARGGMGVVYRARDRETGQTVAVKLMNTADRDTTARFARESHILASLSHPAIVRYVAHGTTDGKPYLAMDWVDGETLHQRMERAGLTIADTLDLGRRVAGALGYAHAKGVVHRDIKPSNLILPDRDLSRVAILDFGVARAPTAGSLTETGAVIGTPAYMAPEQARGDRDIGTSADVFALGCVMYECLTGRRAFEGKHVLALIAKVVLWDPPRASTADPDIPAELDEALVQMLAKDPAKRPREGNAVVAMLEGIQAPSGPGRRSRAHAVPTAVVRNVNAPTVATGPQGKRLASIVLATPPGSAEGSELHEVAPGVADGTMVGIVRAIESHFEVLHDGSILAVVADEATPRDLAARAVRCARALRRAFPEALIAVATGHIGDGDPISETIETLLEDMVASLAREAMALLFAAVGRPDGAIRIDERTAALMTSDNVIRVKSACYLRSEA